MYGTGVEACVGFEAGVWALFMWRQVWRLSRRGGWYVGFLSV